MVVPDGSPRAKASVSMTKATLLLVSVIMVGTAIACGNSRSGFVNGNGASGPGSDVDAAAPLFRDGSADGAGPVATVDAAGACAAAGGSWSGTACTLTENPGALGPADQAKLAAGGSADAAFKFLYPYDATVFPRGLLPPSLQFAGAAPSAVYVHVTSPTLDYKGYFGASTPGRVNPSNAAWTAITLAARPTDSLKVEVTKLSGGAVTGPLTEKWTIAGGSLRGVIYYETYGSTILGGVASVGIMKIQPGASTPTVVANGCGNVCHTASADG